ncbi:MAG TPA: hypothetical protein VF909_06580, partial [Roseiflexaceae bacterium]
MTTQTFPVGQAPRVVLADCRGDLAIEAWDERSVEVHSDHELPVIRQEGDALIIEYATHSLRLRVPADAEISAERVRGDATIQGVRAATLGAVDGDCVLQAIA